MTTKSIDFQTVKRPSGVTEIIEYFKQALIRGDLRPGQRLPPGAELAEQFGVGRSALRERGTLALWRYNGFFLEGVRRGDPPPHDRPDQTALARDDATLRVGDPLLAVSALPLYQKPLGERELQAVCRAAGRAPYKDEGVRFTGEKFVPSDADYKLVLDDAAKKFPV